MFRRAFPRRRRATPSLRLWIGVSCAGLIAVPGAACSGDEDGPRAVEFCAAVDEHAADLTTPRLRDQDDVDAFVALYREVGDKAPLAISEDWDTLTEAYATAGTADPKDPESMNDARQAIFAAERSAVRVHRWLRGRCDVNLGPVTTIVEHRVQVPVTTKPGAG